MTNKHKGSSIESFLQEAGIADETEALALKHVISYQIQQAMDKQNLTKSALAKKMKTSRSALDRLLDPSNTSITLTTLANAARILNKQLKISLT